MFDAIWTASLKPLQTRREVRSFLARGLNDLIGDPGQQDPSRALAGLATGSDREVIDSYRFLQALCAGLTAREARYASVSVSLDVRDLFSKALQRMKELPSDAREILHVKPLKTLDPDPPGQTASIGRGVSQSAALKGRRARIQMKTPRAAHPPMR